MKRFIDETNFMEIHKIYCSKCKMDKSKNFICTNEKSCKQLNMRNIIALNTWVEINKNFVKSKLSEQGKVLKEL